MIPTSVQASGVFDFGEVVEPIRIEILKRVQNDRNEDNAKEAILGQGQGLKLVEKSVPPCPFGFRFDYRKERCEKVFVPENGVMNSDGISVRCEVGYKLVENEKWAMQNGEEGRQNSDESTQKFVCEKIVIPAHGQLSGTGDDFQCDRDFKRVGDLCEKVIIPSNGHLAAGGGDFDCNTGYKKVMDSALFSVGSCVPAEKPVNAKFFPNSDDWYCEAGYRLSDDRRTCEVLVAPANGRRSETGTFFYCAQGYEIASPGDGNCKRVDYPVNAEPNWIGGWDCNQGYKRVGDKCEKAETIEHGKFLMRGADFYCEPRFRKDEGNRKCVKMELPQNAEWDEASYGGWRCRQGYVKNLASNSCDPFNLPEHAFWVGFNAWDCDAGYKKKVDSGQFTVGSCEKVSIPEHAHPSSSYDRWDCDSGYVKNYEENSCEKR